MKWSQPDTRRALAADCVRKGTRKRTPLRAALAVLCCVGLMARGPTAAQDTGTGDRPPTRAPDIHFVPTRQAIVEAMLRLARVERGDVVYNLGSGDGRIVIIAAEKYGAAGVGIELVPRLVEMSREAGATG